MRCINKKRRIYYALCICIIITTVLSGCDRKAEEYSLQYETEHFNRNLYEGTLYAEDLCVTSDNIALNGFDDDSSLHAAGLFDVNAHQVLYADRIHEQLFPASTTKILTAYVALKYGNLSDIVTVSENATTFEPEAQLCGLICGDQLTLYDLLCGLLLYSGNDNAVAIAEHISGSTEAFVQTMNEEAWALGATHTHFVNPHGLHDENHYTTAYDLYLIFNKCISDQRFIDIISLTSYTATITGADGTVRNPVWESTNYYSAGLVDAPEGVKVLGGKTGTTDEAGSCVILYNQDFSDNPYISIIMGADDKAILYDDMTRLLASGVADHD